MSNMLSRGRRTAVLIPMTALAAAMALSTTASAEEVPQFFFEETARADWSLQYLCADGVTSVPANLLVQPTRSFESPDTEDATPTARLQFRTNRNCPDGTRFSWVGTVPAAITSTENLKSLTAQGTGRVRDISGVFHDVTFDVAWTGVGEVQTTVRPIQRTLVGTSIEKERAATATGEVTFDGGTVVNGEANDPFNRPFIRTYEERYTEPPN